MIESISVRSATESDRHDLAHFICGSGEEPFVEEVQTYVRRRSLDDFLVPTDPDAGRRLVVVRGEPGHRLVAVAAHGANHRVVGDDGELVPGSEVALLAIALAVQGDRIGGRSLFRHVVDAVIHDVASCGRGPLLSFVVHEDNVKMLDIVRSSGGFDEQVMTFGHIVFIGML